MTTSSERQQALDILSMFGVPDDYGAWYMQYPVRAVEEIVKMDPLIARYYEMYDGFGPPLETLKEKGVMLTEDRSSRGDQ